MAEIVCVNTGLLGVNTYIVSLAGDDVFVVDPAGCRESGDEDSVISWLSAHGKNPIGIFLTHAHFDHITGIGPIKKAYPNCTVAVHKNSVGAFKKNNPESAYEITKMFGVFQLLPVIADLPEPDVFFDGGETLDKIFTGQASVAPAVGKSQSSASASGVQNLSQETVAALSSWKIIHTPGHTTDSVCLYSEKEESLISGDTLFYMSWGRTDLPGGNEVELQKNLAMLRKTIPPQTKVYPGHEYFGFALSEG